LHSQAWANGKLVLDLRVPHDATMSVQGDITIYNAVQERVIKYVYTHDDDT
jgi:hypothetical protein